MHHQELRAKIKTLVGQHAVKRGPNCTAVILTVLASGLVVAGSHVLSEYYFFTLGKAQYEQFAKSPAVVERDWQAYKPTYQRPERDEPMVSF